VREDRAFPSASVLKAMLLVAYTRHARGRPLTTSERALLSPMIRRSDNDAANELFARVGPAALRRLARAAHMTRFAPATPIWGNSEITARDQTRFFLALETLLPQRHRAYALGLLEGITPSQRWGIGRLSLPGWRVYFKGGWGSGTGRVDHQVALLAKGDQRLAIAVLTRDDGSHAAGKRTLEGVFRRLLSGLHHARDDVDQAGHAHPAAHPVGAARDLHAGPDEQAGVEHRATRAVRRAIRRRGDQPAPERDQQGRVRQLQERELLRPPALPARPELLGGHAASSRRTISS